MDQSISSAIAAVRLQMPPALISELARASGHLAALVPSHQVDLEIAKRVFEAGVDTKYKILAFAIAISRPPEGTRSAPA
jgi:hypothetical protein